MTSAMSSTRDSAEVTAIVAALERTLAS